MAPKTELYLQVSFKGPGPFWIRPYSSPGWNRTRSLGQQRLSCLSVPPPHPRGPRGSPIAALTGSTRSGRGGLQVI